MAGLKKTLKNQILCLRNPVKISNEEDQKTFYFHSVSRQCFFYIFCLASLMNRKKDIYLSKLFRLFHRYLLQVFLLESLPTDLDPNESGLTVFVTLHFLLKENKKIFNRNTVFGYQMKNYQKCTQNLL
jgi:hypothetical protein